MCVIPGKVSPLIAVQRHPGRLRSPVRGVEKWHVEVYRQKPPARGIRIHGTDTDATTPGGETPLRFSGLDLACHRHVGQKALRR